MAARHGVRLQIGVAASLRTVTLENTRVSTPSRLVDRLVLALIGMDPNLLAPTGPRPRRQSQAGPSQKKRAASGSREETMAARDVPRNGAVIATRPSIMPFLA